MNLLERHKLVNQRSNIELITESDTDIASNTEVQEMSNSNQHNYNNLKIYEPEILTAVEKLKQYQKDGLANSLHIGEFLLNFKERSKKGSYSKLLSHPQVCIQKTQAKKFIAVYKYIEKTTGQPTDYQNQLGIEKLYIVSTLDNTEKHCKLEKFAIEQQINVPLLKAIVNLSNEDNSLSFDLALATVKQNIEEKKKNRKLSENKTNNTILSNEYDELKKMYEQLQQEFEDIKNKYKMLQAQTTEKAEIKEVMTNERI
jgi:hypothetical protein